MRNKVGQKNFKMDYGKALKSQRWSQIRHENNYNEEMRNLVEANIKLLVANFTLLTAANKLLENILVIKDILM